MRVVIQRVSKAKVSIAGDCYSEIGNGLLIFAGVEADDSEEDLKWLATKIVSMRIHGDEYGKMNLSVKDTGGDILIVSQFTLHASTKKGNRPSFIRAASPEVAVHLYEKFIGQVEMALDKKVFTGIFGADMQIELNNDGPVTIIMDSKHKE